LLSEVEQICSHVGVMHVGKLVAQSGLSELRARTAVRIRVETHRPDDAAASLGRLGLAAIVAQPGEVTAELGVAEQTEVIETLIRDGVPVRAFGPVPVNLEDVFVTLTGEGFGVSG
ncbi:MAG: ABC transporter ATP-binding protein, partial [Nakamurella sp.]